MTKSFREFGMNEHPTHPQDPDQIDPIVQMLFCPARGLAQAAGRAYWDLFCFELRGSATPSHALETPLGRLCLLAHDRLSGENSSSPGVLRIYMAALRRAAKICKHGPSHAARLANDPIAAQRIADEVERAVRDKLVRAGTVAPEPTAR